MTKGSTVEYEAEKIPYTISHEYCPDFIVSKKDGTIIYIEAKGNGRQFDHAVRAKLIAVKEQSGIDLRIVFYNDGKIGPKRKDGSWMKQSDWAQKNKFTFSISKIPKEWMEE